MRIEKVVVNVSPLITLFRAGLDPLLPQLFPDLIVPDAVWMEVVNRTYDDPATRGLAGVGLGAKAANPNQPGGRGMGAWCRRNSRALLRPAQP